MTDYAKHTDEDLVARLRDIAETNKALYEETRLIREEQSRRTGLVNHVLRWNEVSWRGKETIHRIIVEGCNGGTARGHVLKKDGRPGVYQDAVYDVKKKLAEGRVTDEGEYHDAH